MFQPELEKVGMTDLLKFNIPEWPWLVIGFTGCALTGAIMPVFAIFYGQVFAVRIYNIKKYGQKVFKLNMFCLDIYT